MTAQQPAPTTGAGPRPTTWPWQFTITQEPASYRWQVDTPTGRTVATGTETTYAGATAQCQAAQTRHLVDTITQAVMATLTDPV